MIQARIGVVLGSSSDAPLARKIAEPLRNLGIPFEVTIASAHRTPQDAVNYAQKAKARGIEVIIAVAGLSAALPGVLAAHTTLPIIGLPVESGSLLGLDALFSAVMMPPGVPVACVGINSAVIAALLAARIVAINDSDMTAKVQAYTDMGAEKVRAGRADLCDMGDLPLVPADVLK